MKSKGWFLTVTSILIMAATLPGLRLYQNHERAVRADRLFEAGEYEQARELYRKMNRESEVLLCEENLREQRYREAETLVAAGNYETAEIILQELGEYRKSGFLLSRCAFLRAQDLARQGEPEKALEIYRTLGEDFPGCSEAREALIPQLSVRAMELAKKGELETACVLWRECGGYGKSETLLARGEMALKQRADAGRKKLNDPAARFENPFYNEVYLCEDAYILFPESPGAGTRFFLYFPGGRDEELYTEFLYYYLANPAPDTLAVFLRRNDLPDMAGCCARGLRLMDEAAADCGVFADEVLAAGSSLGAYPALQCPRIAARDFAVTVPCVLSLDAGNEWDEPELVPTQAQCRELAELETRLYLFQPTWVDTSYEPIRRMVDCGCWVMLAGCLQDDHEQISYDVLGMGVVDWALTDRSTACPGNSYSFRRLRQEK